MQMEREKDAAVTETEKVYRHRAARFIELGYTVDESEVLAGSDVDHHELADLVAKGCDLQVAARICM